MLGAGVKVPPTPVGTRSSSLKPEGLGVRQKHLPPVKVAERQNLQVRQCQGEQGQAEAGPTTRPLITSRWAGQDSSGSCGPREATDVARGPAPPRQSVTYWMVSWEFSFS